MDTVDILSEIFNLHKIEYQYIENLIPDNAQSVWSTNAVTLNNLAKVTLLKSSDSIIFAIYPANHYINLAALIENLNISVYFLNISEILIFKQQFDKHDINQLITEHNIQLIFDSEVSDLNTILFNADSNKRYLSVESQYLEKLMVETSIGYQFSETKPEFIFQPNLTLGAPRLNLSNKISNLQTLPILPEIASQILQLQNNSDASVHLLSEIVSKDLALTSLILRYANSALFGLRGSVETIYDAILRVLGYDTVLHLAIGLALGNSFKLDKKGPLGANTIWDHAVFSAAICQKLSQQCPVECRPSPGQAYLAGLLHDIGYLVLASSFETEYFWLNKLTASKPDVPMTVIEYQLLGIQHTELGKILLQSWNMPEFLKVTVSEHHNEDYQGIHCEFSNLVLLVDTALKSSRSSDAYTEKLPDEVVARLGLTEDIIYDTVNAVLECSENLNLMVVAMSA